LPNSNMEKISRQRCSTYCSSRRSSESLATPSSSSGIGARYGANAVEIGAAGNREVVALTDGVPEDLLGRLGHCVAIYGGIRKCWRRRRGGWVKTGFEGGGKSKSGGDLEEKLFGRRRSYQTVGVVLSIKNTNPPITHPSTGISTKKSENSLGCR
jgi:hypothetical protein